MKLIRKNNKKGFTLVELIVVIAIIAILALILIPAISGYVAKADNAALESSARALHTKAVMYVSENGYENKAGLKEVLTDSLSSKFVIVEDSLKVDPKDYTFTFEVKFNDNNKNKVVTVTENGITPLD